MLVRWIVLTEQWPYRISCIINAIKNEVCLEPDTTIYQVYKMEVEQNIDSEKNNDLKSMDLNGQILEKMLQKSEFLTIKRVKAITCFTTNLDFSLQNEMYQKIKREDYRESQKVN